MIGNMWALTQHEKQTLGFCHGFGLRTSRPLCQFSLSLERRTGSYLVPQTSRKQRQEGAEGLSVGSESPSSFLQVRQREAEKLAHSPKFLKGCLEKNRGSLWYETEHQQHPHILKSGVTTCSGVCLVPSKYPNRGSVSGQEHVVFSQKTWVWFTTHLFTTRHGVQLKARAVNSSSRGSKRPSSGLCRHLNSYHIHTDTHMHACKHTHILTHTSFKK